MVMNTDAQRLPPHVLREMYTQSGRHDQLYGGRMTDKRLQVVTSVTTEAIETLHKYVLSLVLLKIPKLFLLNLAEHKNV